MGGFSLKSPYDHCIFMTVTGLPKYDCIHQNFLTFNATCLIFSAFEIWNHIILLINKDLVFLNLFDKRYKLMWQPPPTWVFGHHILKVILFVTQTNVYFHSCIPQQMKVEQINSVPWNHLYDFFALHPHPNDQKIFDATFKV